jgi:hypothetical protein
MTIAHVTITASPRHYVLMRREWILGQSIARVNTELDDKGMTRVQVRLEYFDQNEEFGRALSRKGRRGTIAESVALDGHRKRWSVFQFDEPIEYGQRRHSFALIRSRWANHEVGEQEPTSVFILLPRAADVLEKSTVESSDFEHVAWGMAHTLVV